MRRCTGRGRRCTGRRNLTGRSLVSGFVDAPGRRDDIVAYADRTTWYRQLWIVVATDSAGSSSDTLLEEST